MLYYRYSAENNRFRHVIVACTMYIKAVVDLYYRGQVYMYRIASNFRGA